VGEGALLVVSDGDAFGEGAMDGATRSDLRESLTLLVGQVTAEEKLKIDRRDLPLPGITRQPRLDPVNWPALAFGIQPNREHGSGAEGDQQSLRWRRTGIFAAALHGLVNEEPMGADPRFDLQVAQPRHFHVSCHVFSLC
jgi:hypothetical protein